MTAECDLLSDENDKVKLQITDPSASISLSVSWVKKLSKVLTPFIFKCLKTLIFPLYFRLKILIYLHVTINQANRNVFQIALFQHNFMATVKSHEIVLLLFDISNENSFDWVCKRASVIASTKKSPTSVVLIGRVILNSPWLETKESFECSKLVASHLIFSLFLSIQPSLLSTYLSCSKSFNSA